jgi:hypothetical protein
VFRFDKKNPLVTPTRVLMHLLSVILCTNTMRPHFPPGGVETRGPQRGRRNHVGRGHKKARSGSKFKVSRLGPTIVARPRHASSSYMGPNSEHSQWIFAQQRKVSAGA